MLGFHPSFIKAFKPFVHLSALLNFATSIKLQLAVHFTDEDVEKYKHLGIGRFAGPWKYLTFWNLWIQAIFFSVALINDVRGRNKKRGTAYL